MIGILKKMMVEEKGQGMAEYGLILALIAVVVITALTTMGQSINTKFGSVNTSLQ